MLKLKFSLLLILLYYSSAWGLRCENGKRCELITLIKEFLLVLRQPLRITTSTLCWNRVEFINLTKTLNDNDFLVTPSYGELSTYWPHEQQMFLVDLGCEGAKKLIGSASEQNLLEYPFHWILIEDPLNPYFPPNLKMFVRSKIYIVQELNSKFKIISKYRLGKNSAKYYVNDVALWSENKFEYYNRLVDGRNRTNLRGLLVNTSMVIINPDTNNHLFDTRDKHIEPYTKVTYPLTLHVYEYVNATPRFIKRDTWGYKSNDSDYFIGMLGDIQNGTAEIGGSPIYYVKNRIRYMDVATSATPTKVLFILRALPLSYVKNVYVLPFSKYVWLSCIGLVLVIPIFFYIITYWEFHDKAFNKYETINNSVSRLRPHILDVLQIQVGAIFQQGSESEPISGAGRIATLFLFVAMFFLYTSYSANIVALLQSTTDSIRTLEDLLNSRIALGVEENPYNRYFFTMSTGKVQQAIYRQKVEPPGERSNFMTLEEGVEKMRTEYFAFHTEATTAYKFVSDTFLEHEKCGLIEIEYFSMFEPYYCIRKNSTYGEIFKAALRKMSESGVGHRLRTRVYMKRPACQNQGGNFLSVSLMDCYAPVLIFGIGVGISLFVFVLEKIVHSRKIASNSDTVDGFNADNKTLSPPPLDK